MQHVVDASHRALGHREVCEVSLNQLDARNVRQVLALAGDEAVRDAHAFTAANQLFNQMGSDESGTAGDEVRGHCCGYRSKSVAETARRVRRQPDTTEAGITAGIRLVGSPGRASARSDNRASAAPDRADRDRTASR